LVFSPEKTYSATAITENIKTLNHICTIRISKRSQPFDFWHYVSSYESGIITIIQSIRMTSLKNFTRSFEVRSNFTSCLGLWLSLQPIYFVRLGRAG